jgi:hypothetical protein
MIPMKTSSIFKSRWMAILWAAGILWLAWDVAGSSSEGSNTSENAEAPTDATGSAINPDDEKKLEQAIRNL